MIKHNDEVYWFVGVVEDRDDPMKLGRVQVRVYGQHPFIKVKDDIMGLPTEDLIWMPLGQDTTSAAISGVGQSPTGICLGSHVFGLFLDPYKINAIVLATYAGNYTEQPNINEGFSDPTGEFPRYLGNDVNVLARGGEEGRNTIDIQNRDLNQSVAVNPDEGPVQDIPEDNNPENFTLKKMLSRDEGINLKIFWDVKGYSVGVGHFIGSTKGDTATARKILSQQIGRTVTGEPGSITNDEAQMLFDKDVNKQLGDMSRYPKIMAAYTAAGDNTPRKWALINLSFNMGAAGLNGFTNSLALMAQQKWAEAAKNMKDSKWFHQVAGRGPRICNTIQFGNLEAYGVMAPRPQGKSLSAARAIEDEDPSAPWTPEDSRIMFKEPISAYDAVYPYNKVFESESGHIIEIDDTPSHERMHWRHTTGTYEEWRPSGDISKKVKGNSFDFAEGDRNISTEANENHVVSAALKQYVMGNITIQTDGEHLMIVRGARVLRVEGNSTVLVDGDSIVNVEGNATIDVKGNCDQKIEGDYNLTVQGNYNVSILGQRIDTVQGTWNRNTQGAVSDISSSVFSVDGSRINLG